MTTTSRQQIEANASTAGAWSLYSCHRRRVTELVTSRAAVGARLCVLGAGNCNDLDLARVGVLFAETHLVDLDPIALDRALPRVSSRQGVSVED